jgi:hypothetical protein
MPHHKGVRAQRVAQRRLQPRPNLCSGACTHGNRDAVNFSAVEHILSDCVAPALSPPKSLRRSLHIRGAEFDSMSARSVDHASRAATAMHMTGLHMMMTSSSGVRCSAHGARYEIENVVQLHR